MSRSLNIVAADDEEYMREYYQELLPRLGHQVVVASSGRQLIELCRTGAPQLVITDIKMADLDGLSAAAEINRDQAVPVVLVSAHHDPALRERARQDYVMAYLAKPVKQPDLEVAIDMALMRFQQFQEMRLETASLRQALDDRKLIERAKGVIMKRLGVDEEESFRRLRKLASDQNKKLIEVARIVTASEEVFAALEHERGVGEGRHAGAEPRRDRAPRSRLTDAAARSKAARPRGEPSEPVPPSARP